jgi:hypothetical protein
LFLILFVFPVASLGFFLIHHQEVGIPSLMPVTGIVDATRELRGQQVVIEKQTCFT